jgi:hypothetical protein
MAYPFRPMSTSRYLRHLLIVALAALLALALGALTGVLLADRAGAHACVGDWRVDQWQSAIDDSASIIEIARPELVGLPLCSTPGPDETTSPTPVPSPPPPPAEIEAIIAAQFAGHPYVSVTQAQAIAWCESRYEPSAKNRHSSAGGLFQFLVGTWRSEAAHFGYPTDPANRFDPVLAAGLAALVMERDQGPRQWLCKG